MLLQTNSYVVPADRRADHNRLMKRFRQTLLRLGCDHFEVYEQAGPGWAGADPSGRFVQILRFADRKHQMAVQAAERNDPKAQAVIADFCDLIRFADQQSQGLFVTGYYTGVLSVATPRAADPATVDPTGSANNSAGDSAGDSADGTAGQAVGDADGETAGPALTGTEQPTPPPAVPYADSGGAVVDPVPEIVAEVTAAAAIAEVAPFTELAPLADALPPPRAGAEIEHDPFSTARVHDDASEGVLATDDNHRSAPPPEEGSGGGTGLPSMFSDDYLDEEGGPHVGPPPVDFDFDDSDGEVGRPANHPSSHDEPAPR